MLSKIHHEIKIAYEWIQIEFSKQVTWNRSSWFWNRNKSNPNGKKLIDFWANKIDDLMLMFDRSERELTWQTMMFLIIFIHLFMQTRSKCTQIVRIDKPRESEKKNETLKSAKKPIHTLTLARSLTRMHALAHTWSNILHTFVCSQREEAWTTI